MDPFYRTLNALIAANRPAVVATVIEAVGSTPRAVGAKMIIARAEQGAVEVFFSIGGGPLEATVIEQGKELLAGGAPCIKEYRLNQKDPLGLYMSCGGSLKVFFEPVAPPDELYLFGSGTVALSIAQKAQGLGFAITVFDDRPERFALFGASASAVQVDWSEPDCLPDVQGRYAVILTRCHRTDKTVLSRLIGSGAKYLGLIGSRAKIMKMREELERELNFSSSIWDELHAPVGLPIGADSPDEIAISIWAEILQARNKLKQAAQSAAGFQATESEFSETELALSEYQ